MNQHELLVNLIQQLLSYAPGGPLLSGLVSTPLASWMSPSSSLSNAYMWPGQNQSMNSVAYEFMDNMRRASFNVSAKHFSTEQQIRALTEYHRMLNPELSDAALRGLAENSSDNFFDVGGMLYSALDPYKLKAGLAAASDVASILHRRGSSMSLRGAEYAHRISQELMGRMTANNTMEGGMLRDIIDNPSLYGNMSVADVMAIGKEIALSDKSGFVDSSGKNFDATRFKTKVQEMSKALEPWKDIFGKDVPEMLNQLEALTGNSIGASSAADIQSLGNRMMSILGSTGAKIQHIAAYKDALSSSLIDPTMTNRSILGASAIAGEMVLGLSNLGVSHMTSQELQSVVSRIYAGTGRSKFSDRYALAYAKWAEGATNPNDDDFRSAVMKAIAGGMSSTEALLAASGASSLESLEAYRNTDGFLNSVKTGASQRATMEAMTLKASRNTLSMYTAENFKAYNQTVRTYLENLAADPARFEEFFGLSTSEKIARLRQDGSIKGLNLSPSELTQIVADLEGSAGSGLSIAMGSDINRGQATSIYAERYNYRRQNKIAKEQQAFNAAVQRLMTPGGFSSFLAEIKGSKGKANIGDLFKKYTGGSEMLDVLLSTEGIVVDNDNEMSMYRQGINFARNNYAELPGMFKSVYDLMMGRSPEGGDKAKQIKKGYRIAAELNALGHGALSKMTAAEQKKLIDDLHKADLDYAEPKNIGKVARNLYIDSTISRNLAKLRGTEGYEKNKDIYDKLADEMIKHNSESVSHLEKHLERVRKEKNIKMSDAEKKVFRDLTKGIGDIDGVDPLQSIAKALEQLPELINRLITAFSGGKPQGG